MFHPQMAVNQQLSTYRIPYARTVPCPAEDVQPDVERLHVKRWQQIVEWQQRQIGIRPGEEVDKGASVEKQLVGSIRVQGDEEECVR